uniref:C-type lectin domain-containing protein n=1 Tax=Sphaeramia orbicularis TaxID=375764 RepID=A0A673BQ71_9TELE
METVLHFLTAFAGLHFGKYVYISNGLPWKQAQNFCRIHFTDLSPITSLSEEDLLKNVTAGIVRGRFWTGLHWNKTHWKWSGGYTGNIPAGIVGVHHSGKQSATFNPYLKVWSAENTRTELPFLCINLVNGEMRKSWEEALESCRQNHTSLTTLTSEAEFVQVKRKIRQDHITDRVWIGLRFLRNRWMWMSRDPLVYQTHPEASQDHQCPATGRCGALNKQGLLENWDCQDKLNFICS